MEHETQLLNHLDKPVRFFGIHKDEAFAFCGPLGIGFAMGYFLTGFFVGFGLYAALRWLKKKNEGECLRAAFYWYFPHLKKKHVKISIPSYIREWIG